MNDLRSMGSDDVKRLVARTWELELNKADDRTIFANEVGKTIEDLIASNNEEAISCLISLYPVERFFIQVYIDCGCKRAECFTPKIEKLQRLLEGDREYNDAVQAFIDDRCKASNYCEDFSKCSVLTEHCVPGLTLQPREVELYKKWCAIGFSEFEADR